MGAGITPTRGVFAKYDDGKYHRLCIAENWYIASRIMLILAKDDPNHDYCVADENYETLPD